MSRHSKNNTGSSIFTYGERQKLKGLNEWGEVSSRIGADSQKKFEQCSLCLNRINDPVCCMKGHMYCRQCIIENLLFQKKQNKIKIKEYNEKQSTIEKINENKEQNEIKKIALLKKVEELSTKKELDESSKGNPIIEKKQFVKGETKNCFWIPEQTPSNKSEQLKKPLDILYCPSSSKQHSIKLKELITLKLIQSKNNEEKFVCSVCEKDLSIQKIVCLKACGHVICQHCLDIVCSKEEKCSLCGVKYSPSEIIRLQESGTGFSTHNKVVTNSFTPFFKY